MIYNVFFKNSIPKPPTRRTFTLKNYFKYILLLFQGKYKWLINTKKIQKQLKLKSTKRLLA